MLSAAARALRAGDVLGALKRVSLRQDPPALALRGIAMARLGELPRARELLRDAARAFGPREAMSRARCVVAAAEVALAMRDLQGSPRTLAQAVDVLRLHGDRANALQGKLVAVRRALLVGRLDEAASTLATVDAHGASPSLAAVAELARAELALRSLDSAAARSALDRARAAAERAGVASLHAEVLDAHAALERPAARRVHAGQEQRLRIDEVEALLASDALVLDACRRRLQAGDQQRPLARRPVLFAIARSLAQAWPADVDRNVLIAAAFSQRRPDDTHRARLRVEVGRLRRLAAPLARIEATARGYRLAARGNADVVVLEPPIDDGNASLLALLADGAAWSTSALALALDASQRTVQRALAELQDAGQVRSVGRGRAQRWVAPPLAGFTTILLLPASVAST